MTPRCGAPVKAYELSRPPDALDAVPRPVAGTTPCYRPAGHAGREKAAGRPVRHASEASVKRDRRQTTAWKRRTTWKRQRQEIPDARKMTAARDRTAA